MLEVQQGHHQTGGVHFDPSSPTEPDRITYGEQNDSSKLYQSVLHVVQGELTSLASHESVSTVYPSSEASFYAGYSEFIPGAPLVDGNGVHIDAAANSTLGSSLSIAEGSRVVISSNAALTGRSFVITGTDSADQPVTETLTFGADDRLLASTTRWKTVTGVALEAADVTDVLDGYVSVRGSTVYTEPEAIIVRTSSDNQPVFTVHGLDAQGNAVHVRVEGLTDELFQAVGALKEFYGVTFETSGDVGVFHQSTAGSDVDAEGFHSIALTGADNQGQVVFAGGPQRIVLTPDGNGSEHVFRVTGKDATGQTVTEYIHGANPSDNGGSAITVHAFASVSDIAVSVADWWGLEGLSVGTLSPTSLGEDVTLSRFGGEVALGNPVAAFESASQLTFSSADDLSGRTLTIHGIDAVGHAVTEVLTGFQAGGGTLLSVNHYLSVSEIDVSAGGAGAIKVGYMTLGGAMLDNFVVTGSGTAEDPFVGHSLNTLESARLYANASAAANASESDVLLYVDCSGATGPVSLHYNLSLRGTPEQDTLYLEYSGERVPLAQGVAYFADGAGTATVDITIQGDDVKEAIEQGTLVLANASTGVTVDRSHDTAVIKVLNDDDEVSLDVTAQSVVEGTGGETFIEFTLTRTAPGIVKDVAWAIELSNLGQGLTAAQANDFVNGALTGVATFADDATETKVRVAIATDDVYESPESFRVYLPTPQVGSGYALVGNTSAIGTIENDDVSVQVSVNQAEQAEGGSFVFTVSRLGNLSQASHLTWRLVYEGGDDAAAAVDADFTTATRQGNTGAVNVDWELTGVGIDAVKASDFESDVLPSGILHFASNEMSKTITIEALADMVVERDELMRVTLTGSDDPAQRILASYADAVIVNDDVVSASGSTIETGDGSALVLGGSGNDTIIGGTGASEIRAGAGDDVIHSGGGADHVYAGDGNDTIYLDADSLSHFQPDAADLARTFVDGGTGFDTVVFDVSGTSIDLTAIMKQVDGVSGMRGIECIDVSHASGQGGNTLMLDASALGLQDVDVFSTTDGSGLKQLMVKGGAGDSVVITDFSGSADGIWAQTGSYTDAGVGYDLYLNAELKLQLLVQNSMNASIHNV